MKFQLIILFTVFSLPAWSQIHSQAPVTVTANTRVALSGALGNHDSLYNEGEIFIAGNWDNTGSYVSSQGKIFLDGLQPQNVTSGPLQINYLQIDGGDLKTFNNNVTITGELRLNDGFLTPADTTVRIVMAENAEIRGGSAASFVNGMLYLTGTGNLYFPIGKDGLFLPAELVDVRGGIPVVGFEVTHPNPNPIAGIGLASISGQRYWRRHLLSGTYNPAKVAFTVHNDENFTDEANVVVTEAETLDGGFRSLGQYDFYGTVMDGFVTSLKDGAVNYYALGVVQDIADQTAFYIPSALSPMAPDPEDAVIKIYSSDIRPDDFVFRIFNKRGELIFESLSYPDMANDGWSGINIRTGHMSEPGIYTYTMTCRFRNGNQIDKTGSITLIQ